ncbi:MAG: HEAT repeat domain-containing protein, partial [Planctomycetaceae bacterium]|nr:HEAT repeat domain-containing protein [Planctomycetaceae bacterium]
FYNAIIGHYEVPLEHPKRDRTRGRVWRVVYRGPEGSSSPNRETNLTKLTPRQLIDRLADENLVLRTLATNWLVEGHPKQAAALVRKEFKNYQSAEQRAHGLWVIERLERLTDAELTRLANDPHRLVRVHLMKALAERKVWSPQQSELVRAALEDEDAFVRRAAADGLGRHPSSANWEPLLATWDRTALQDTHMIHTLKMALKSHFESDSTKSPPSRDLSSEHTNQLLKIAAACSTPQAAAFLLERSDLSSLDKTTQEMVVRQVARHGSADQVTRLIADIRRVFGPNLGEQFIAFEQVTEGLTQRGITPKHHPEMRVWFEELAPALLTRIEEQKLDWVHQSLPKFPNSPPPWGVRQRRTSDNRMLDMIDSISQGEQLTGVYRSPPFELPKTFRFWMCGHNGFPNTNPPPVNHVRLRLLK